MPLSKQKKLTVLQYLTIHLQNRYFILDNIKMKNYNTYQSKHSNEYYSFEKIKLIP